MNDLALPDGWKCGARRGWPLMQFVSGSQSQAEVELVEFSKTLFHPKFFELTVEVPDEATTTMFFSMSSTSKEVRLASVMSTGADVDVAVDTLRKHRPIYWWKTKAIDQLAREETREVVAIIASHSPEDVPRIEESAERLYERLRDIPTTRRSTRVGAHVYPRVADLYIAAKAVRTPTTAAVKKGLESDGIYVSSSRVAHLIVEARKRGLIEPKEGPND